MSYVLGDHEKVHLSLSLDLFLEPSSPAQFSLSQHRCEAKIRFGDREVVVAPGSIRLEGDGDASRRDTLKVRPNGAGLQIDGAGIVRIISGLLGPPIPTNEFVQASSIIADITFGFGPPVGSLKARMEFMTKHADRMLLAPGTLLTLAP
jgi:hypothetical protein